MWCKWRGCGLFGDEGLCLGPAGVQQSPMSLAWKCLWLFPFQAPSSSELPLSWALRPLFFLRTTVQKGKDSAGAAFVLRSICHKAVALPPALSLHDVICAVLPSRG